MAHDDNATYIHIIEDILIHIFTYKLIILISTKNTVLNKYFTNHIFKQDKNYP